jgi:hypothetical protein
MRPRPVAALWMGSAFGAALAVAAGVLVVAGTGEKGIDAALRATARVSFLLFWVAYAGSAMASLFGSRFQILKLRAREFGLAFASAQLVHIGLVVWLCLIGAAPDVSTFVFFGIALVWVYLLALFSIGRMRRALGPGSWWILRTIGLNYIAYAFIVDLLRNPLHGGVGHVVEYLPFATLAIAGPVLRLAAFVQRLGPAWRQFPYRTG